MILKRLSFVFCLLLSISTSFSQELYWVVFTDKNNTQFDPYTYFDAKAIERRQLCGLSLYDSTDFPLNEQYIQAVTALSEEVIGESRWLNALAVRTIYIDKIKQFPFVSTVESLHTEAIVAANNTVQSQERIQLLQPYMADQLWRMQGDRFVKRGLNGKGVRIAILDGGFKMWKTHPAFELLRVNHQIVKTYNFPLKKEDVDGWDSHGTMVFSCIAGMYGDTMLGLATGAEFLLARTEVQQEPAREEVWWMMGMEWADKNGAQIINSSLGYGQHRYNPNDMDGKTSLVSRAANIAAAKGILVCNSMGNEGEVRSWRTLVTPADADSVLSVGGVDASGLPETFTSWGPTFDGRRKPNVCAYGTAFVANPAKRIPYVYASGTSFSSPLLAGFAACAWQAKPDLTNMQLMKEIERSADLYPYFDYVYGYGVPQASYFTDVKKDTSHKMTFFFEVQEDAVVIRFPNNRMNGDYLHYHVQASDGHLIHYGTFDVEHLHTSNLSIPMSKLEGGIILRVCYDGYIAEYNIPKEISQKQNDSLKVPMYYKNLKIVGVNAKVDIAPYLAWGFVVPSGNADKMIHYGKSESVTFGVRVAALLTKWYSIGGALEIGATWYNLKNSHSLSVHSFTNDLSGKNIRKQNLRSSYLQFEIFQRFRLVPGGLLGYSWFIDTGCFGGWVFSNRYKAVCSGEQKSTFMQQANNMRKWQWGVRLRIGYEFLACFVQYRISNLYQKTEKLSGMDLPKIETGLQIFLPVR